MKKKFKLIIIIIGILGMIFFGITKPLVVFATSIEEQQDLEQKLIEKISGQLDNIDFSRLEDYVDGLDDNTRKLLGDQNFINRIKSILSGEIAIEYDNFFQVIIDTLLQTIKQYSPMFIVIISVALISALATKFNTKNYEKSTNPVINFVCIAVIIVVLATAVKGLSASAAASIESMKGQMDAAFPILLALTAALGGTVSVSVYQPAVAILSSGITVIFTQFIMPLFMIFFVFAIVGNLSNSIKLDKFNAFFYSLFKWTVGIIFTVFFAFLSIQGISAGMFDSISIRTAKFTIKSYVPILGGYLSDGFDLILSSSLLIKNSIGIVGIILVFATVLAPIFQIVVFTLLLKLVSAILQPIADAKVSSFLDSTAKSLSILSTCVIGVAFMYLIVVGLVMCTGNIIL